MAVLRNLRAAVLRKDKNVDETRMMFIRTSDCSLARQKEDWNTEKAVRGYAGKSPIFRSVSRNGKQVEEIAARRENSLRYVVVQVLTAVYRQKFRLYFLLPFLFLSI